MIDVGVPRSSLGAWWDRVSLATRYAAVSSVVLAVSALGIGWVVSRAIEEVVVRNSANATALWMESFLSPISDRIAAPGPLSPGAERALVELFENTPLGQRVASYKIWRPDGTVLAAHDPALVGRTFPPTAALQAAFAGRVTAEFDELGDEESAGEAATGLPLLEIYSPVREVWTGEVIAVAEFYEMNETLPDDLARARWRAWAAVTGTTAGLGLLLWVVVLGGSRTIDTQRLRLDSQLDELRRLSDRNRELRLRVQAAASRASEETDRQLRRLGADLHDGPAQNLAFAALRLDALRRSAGPDGGGADGAAVAQALAAAMEEVRALSRGLALPTIAGRPLAEIVRSAVEAHRMREGIEVQLDLTGAEAEPALTEAARICAYRFVQEGLTNAARHGAGRDVEVALATSAGGYRLAVRDRGPGLPDGPPPRGLGLAGLRDRVESLGGRFRAGARPGGGTELEMSLEEET